MSPVITKMIEENGTSPGSLVFPTSPQTGTTYGRNVKDGQGSIVIPACLNCYKPARLTAFCSALCEAEWNSRRWQQT